MNGLLLIDKPTGWTSFDVVNYVRKLVAQAENKKPKHTKVGHTGTLDPLATGLLVLLVGKEYTRRAQELTKLDKTYEVTMKLGETSTTGDGEGEKQAVTDKQPPHDEIRQAIEHFQGEIMQTPPLYSAIKINGVRAYKLARAGSEATLEPRPVTIFSSTLDDYVYPHVSFTAAVSSGTYIRSLVTDLGDYLTTGAYMSALRRTRVGDFTITDAVAPTTLSAESIAELLRQL